MVMFVPRFDRMESDSVSPSPRHRNSAKSPAKHPRSLLGAPLDSDIPLDPLLSLFKLILPKLLPLCRLFASSSASLNGARRSPDDPSTRFGLLWKNLFLFAFSLACCSCASLSLSRIFSCRSRIVRGRSGWARYSARSRVLPLGDSTRKLWRGLDDCSVGRWGDE